VTGCLSKEIGCQINQCNCNCIEPQNNVHILEQNLKQQLTRHSYAVKHHSKLRWTRSDYFLMNWLSVTVISNDKRQSIQLCPHHNSTTAIYSIVPKYKGLKLILCEMLSCIETICVMKARNTNLLYTQVTADN